MLLLNLLNFSISYDTEKFRKGAGMDYSVGCDIELVQELLGMSRGALADASGLSLPTLNRWINDASARTRRMSRRSTLSPMARACA